jgi:hypothetical protein
MSTPKGYKRCTQCGALIPKSAKATKCHYCQDVNKAVAHNSSWLCATDF